MVRILFIRKKPPDKTDKTPSHLNPQILQICNKYFNCRHDGKARPILTKFISLTYYQSQQLQDINRKPPRPPITPYRHVKPLDWQTYHQHHRRAHSANGEQWRGVSDY